MGVKVKDLTFSYGGKNVLDAVSFEAADGELLSVLGPNGVGKSTLFRCILGLLSGYGGSVTVDGRSVRELTATEMARTIAYIPQSSYPSFNYSVMDMVLMGTTSQLSALSSPGAKQKQAAAEAIERVGIAHLRDKSYTRISGGERQLVLIARALVQNARVLVLDEPTANLDYGNQLSVMAQVRGLTDSGYAVVQSTHNPEQAFMFSHRILALHAGRVIANGPPSETVTSQLMKTLYGADIEVCSLYDDRLRICVPRSVVSGER